MGRVSVALPIHGNVLREYIGERRLSKAAKSIGITRQALNAILKENLITPRRLADMAKYLDLSALQVKALQRESPTIKEMNREIHRLRKGIAEISESLSA